MRAIATVLALAAMVIPASALGQTWTCSAEAKFATGHVFASLVVTAPGKLSSKSIVTYEPAGVRPHFGLGVEYPADKASGALPRPTLVQAVVPASTPPDADVVLIVGGSREFRSFELYPTRQDVADRYVGFQWTGALQSALASGGGASLAVRRDDGRVVASQTLTFASAAEIEAVTAKVLAVARGYAADPAKSEFCTSD